ncbi:selenium metabolism membrane protein YedE/FdhT [Sporosarcina oncorhynchi]|uniref:Selenium metabolism membrane protein YedE/FdhT n=1 Tax=Sporosarcina oncorhynchi TaxID=3056444 RepID=A0ABZ0L544_9BACL|nr:selenium metabolism membrane protein YedE/FdhT [Sporosarcina sp. T2O-4]WOV87681.1 selenium metabolism membrane protein YedE/FdhT [Sporosarcina sp. T2O-4]
MKTIIQPIFQRYWNPYVVLLIAGILSALYFGLTSTVWAVTGEFTRLGGDILKLFGVNISGWQYYDMVHLQGSTWNRPDGWIVWGMFAGALIMVLLSNNFKIRRPQQKRRYVQGLVGGIIAGFGARLALGCNLAAFFTGVPQFSFHSWIFIVATGIGTYFGAKLTKTRWWKGRPTLTKGAAKPSTIKKRIIQPYVGSALAIAYLSLTIYFFATGQKLLGFGALFGLAFGILIERGQICFTSAFRDLFLVGRSVMAKAIIVGMAISSIITVIIISVYDLTPITQIAALSTFVGGVLFGLGIVMASGCETGMMYRLMEGQVLFLPVFAGNIIGATFLAYAWDHLGVYDVLAKSGTKINLLDSIGPVGAIIATLAMLGILYAFTIWQEKRYHRKLTMKRGVRTHAS